MQLHDDCPYRAINDERICHVIDLKEWDDVYTVPISNTTTQPCPILLPPAASEATHVGLEQSQSSDYCNGRKYQPLSPETKEYISIYSTTTIVRQDDI